MKRALIIIAASLGGLLVLVGITIAAVLFFVDPNDFKDDITALVKDKTDMTLTLQDRLEWSIWPNIGVKLGKTSLADAEAGETLLAMDMADLSVQLMPLFSGKAAVNAVYVKGAKIRFIQHADGSTSWDRFLAKISSDDKESSSENVDFNIKKLYIRDSSATLIDEKEKTERVVSDIKVTAKDIGLAKPFPLELAFVFQQKDGEGKTLDVKNNLNTLMTLDTDKQHYLLEKLALNSALSGSLLPAPATIDLNANISANMADEKIDITGMQIKATYADKALREPAQLSVNADIAANLKSTVANISNLTLNAEWPDASRPQNITAALTSALTTNWTEGSVNAKPLTLKANVSDKAWPKPIAVEIEAPLNANWLKGDLEIPALLLKTLGMEIKGNLLASLPAMAATDKNAAITKDMTAEGKIASNSFNPRNVMTVLGIEAPKTADANVLKNVNFSAALQADDKKALLKDLRIKLDETTITGEAGITDLDSMRQFARLSLDKINADRYLPPEEKAGSHQKSASSTTASNNEPMLPIDLLKEQNLDIALTAGSLTVMQYPISAMRLAVTANKGLVNVNEMKGTIYNGGFNVPVAINVQGKQPVIKLQPSLQHMEIGPIAKKLLNKDFIEGKASYTGNLTVQGNTINEWMKSVTGTSDLRFDDGLLHGVNAMQEAVNALGKYQVLLALAGKDADTLISKSKDTEIASFAANNTLEGGVLHSKGLNADLKKGKVNGSGSFNLVTQELDYRFSLNMDKSVVGEKNAGYALPVVCKGNLAGNMATLCKLDAKGMGDIALKAATAKGLEKLGLKGEAATPEEAVKQKAKEEVGKKLNEGLQKLFKR